MKQDRRSGITLIALVITIIVLLILAGVAIATLTGDNGILTKAVQAKEKTEKAAEDEALKLDAMASMDENGKIKYNTATTVEEAIKQNLPYKNNTKITDRYGNKITIPAGFKVIKDDPTEPTPTVKDGIIVQDATYEGTIGSEFVWIPVGNIKKSETETITINLSRYTFDSEGNETSHFSEEIENSYAEDTKTSHESEYKNEIASNIEEFTLKASSEKSGGYYIGRYEARVDNYDADAIITEKNNSEINWTGYQAEEGKELKLVTKSNSQVWNYITQRKASEVSKKMYEGKEFSSDLMNSYAWDTAILFLQTFDDRALENKSIYSLQKTLNMDIIANEGTNNLLENNKDKICNVWDIASNCFEWTTETHKYTSGNCVARGGSYSDKDYCASYRRVNGAGSAVGSFGFRPILYL